MTSAQITGRIVKLIETYGFTKKATVVKTPTAYAVVFNVRSTATRSSSIVTRIRLMLEEFSPMRDNLNVSKYLDQELPPVDRASLADYRIIVTVRLKK